MFVHCAIKGIVHDKHLLLYLAFAVFECYFLLNISRMLVQGVNKP